MSQSFKDLRLYNEMSTLQVFSSDLGAFAALEMPTLSAPTPYELNKC